MLHCFQCGTDLPDNLVYCLQCGARLDDDEVTTVVEQRIVTPPDDRTPVPVEPKRGGGAAKLLIGGLLGAGLVAIVAVILGIMLLNSQGGQKQVNGVANGNRNVAPAATATATSTSTPKKTSPTPSPTPANDNGGEKTLVRVCEIINPAGGSVNLRRDCETRDCAQDPSTVYMQGEPGDLVELTDRSPVNMGRFTWVQVKYEGETLWISAARINCQ